jgi:soluble lytic murein transglycosylase-like protein
MSFTPQNAWNNNPQTGLTTNPGPFLAEVMKNDDPLFSGRLLVYIPDMGGDPAEQSSWHLVRYMTPFYGIQPLSNSLGADPASQHESYGMWMNSPDVGIKVLVMFINGDRSRGVWIGCLPEIGSHGAIPGQDKGDFDVYANYSAATNDIKAITRPPHSTASTFSKQGLENDTQRGPVTSSSLRESPSKVFGFNTPGSHSFVMDDGDTDGSSKIIRIRTAGGNQIMMNDDSGFVYLINAAGTAWFELSPSGHVDIYGESGISIATKGSINMHADENINMHAGKHIKIVAEVGAKIQGTQEMQVVGTKLWLEGVDSIEQHSCGQIKLTANKGMFFKSSDNIIMQGKCFKWNSGSAMEAEQTPLEEVNEVSGYNTTVSRAPSHEPFNGHDSTSANNKNTVPAVPAQSTVMATNNAQATTPDISIVRQPATSSILPVAGPGYTTADTASVEKLRKTQNLFDGSSLTALSTTERAYAQAMGYLTPAKFTTAADGSAVRGFSAIKAVARVVTAPLDSIRDYLKTIPAQAGSTNVATPLTSLSKQLSDNPLNVQEAYNRLTNIPSNERVPFNAAATVMQISNITSLANNIGAMANNAIDSNIIGAGLARATPAIAGPIAEASNALKSIQSQLPFSSIPALPGGGIGDYFATGDNCLRPGGPGQSGASPLDGAAGANPDQLTNAQALKGAPKNIVPPAELANDPAWQAELAKLKKQFPELNENQLYQTIQGESGFNSTVVAGSGATGLFQFMPATARGLGTTTAQIQNMTPAQQLTVYGKYLKQANYKGGPLGMIQAAPGTYSNLIRQYGTWPAVPRQTEVYSTSSAAWRQNPGWRGPDGLITIGSIETYYNKQ